MLTVVFCQRQASKTAVCRVVLPCKARCSQARSRRLVMRTKCRRFGTRALSIFFEVRRWPAARRPPRVRDSARRCGVKTCSEKVLTNSTRPGDLLVFAFSRPEATAALAHASASCRALPRLARPALGWTDATPTNGPGSSSRALGGKDAPTPPRLARPLFRFSKRRIKRARRDQPDRVLHHMPK